ncbi:hypothetical protein FB451DRAFT_1163957 [Mycena latifolia]|nr:hypothetical protein FB451DRAFT_1163957 [Mycena latifolia]
MGPKLACLWPCLRNLLHRPWIPWAPHPRLQPLWRYYSWKIIKYTVLGLKTRPTWPKISELLEQDSIFMRPAFMNALNGNIGDVCERFQLVSRRDEDMAYIRARERVISIFAPPPLVTLSVLQMTVESVNLTSPRASTHLSSSCWSTALSHLGLLGVRSTACRDDQPFLVTAVATLSTAQLNYTAQRAAEEYASMRHAAARLACPYATVTTAPCTVQQHWRFGDDHYLGIPVICDPIVPGVWRVCPGVDPFNVVDGFKMGLDTSESQADAKTQGFWALHNGRVTAQVEDQTVDEEFVLLRPRGRIS